LQARFRAWLRAALACAALDGLLIATGALGPAAAQALAPPPGEAAALEDCNRRACAMLLEKKGEGDDLQCQLTKTWPEATIKRADRPAVRWRFGDARCSVNLTLRRADIIAALSKPDYEATLAPHRVACTIADSGQERTVAATVSPKIVFAQGKAQKIWVNLIGTEGNHVLADFLWLAVKLEDSTGLFHAAMVTAVNRYIYERCPSTYARALAGGKS
jgi:hypothetical protein